MAEVATVTAVPVMLAVPVVTAVPIVLAVPAVPVVPAVSQQEVTLDLTITRAVPLPVATVFRTQSYHNLSGHRYR